MKINSQKILNKLPYLFLILAIFANNEVVCVKNLKSSTTADGDEKDGTQPPISVGQASASTQATTQALANNYDVKTAIYVMGEVLKKVKTPKLNKDLYEKCIEETVKQSADASLKKVWEYFSKIDYKNKEKILIGPIQTFIDDAMSETNLEIEQEVEGKKMKVKENCAKSCKQNSVGEINENLQLDLIDLLQNYFQPIVPFKGKNMITAFMRRNFTFISVSYFMKEN